MFSKKSKKPAEEEKSEDDDEGDKGGAGDEGEDDDGVVLVEPQLCLLFIQRKVKRWPENVKVDLAFHKYKIIGDTI